MSLDVTKYLESLGFEPKTSFGVGSYYLKHLYVDKVSTSVYISRETVDQLSTLSKQELDNKIQELEYKALVSAAIEFGRKEMQKEFKTLLGLSADD